MEIKQGEIYLANLNPVRGHEQAGYRPVLVVQNDILNQNLTTLVVLPITSNLKYRNNLTVYFLGRENSSIKEDSVILLFQIRTIDKIKIKKKIGKISQEEFLKVRRKLNNVF